MLNTEVLLPALGYGAILPAFIAAAIALPLLLRPQSLSLGRALGALAVAAGVLGATFALGLAPLRPEPDREWHWVPALTVLGAIVGAVGCCWSSRIVGGLILAGLSTYLLVPTADTYPHRDAIRIALPCAIFALTLLDIPIRAFGRRTVVVFGLTTACAAVVLERGATASFSQMAGALAAALGGVWLASHRPGVAGGVLPIVAVLVPGLMACGFFNTYSNVPIASYLLVVVAPLTLAFRVKGRLGLAVTGVALAILATAVGLAVWAEPFDISTS